MAATRRRRERPEALRRLVKAALAAPSIFDAVIAMPQPTKASDWDEPMFCCCEFIDRHGKRTHLMDASSCDDLCVGCLTCSPLGASQILADADDRLRLPQYNGAVHVGFDGALPALLLPLLAATAARSPQHAIAVCVLLPPALMFVHRQTLRTRRRPRFFVGWTFCSFVYGNLYFTLAVGEHFSFGYWLVCAALHLAAVACASSTRGALPAAAAGCSGEALAAPRCRTRRSNSTTSPTFSSGASVPVGEACRPCTARQYPLSPRLRAWATDGVSAAAPAPARAVSVMLR